MLPQLFHLLQGFALGLGQVFQAEEEAGDIQKAEQDKIEYRAYAQQVGWNQDHQEGSHP